MKWSVLNALGGIVWLAGLSVAKGASLPVGLDTSVGDHRFVFGIGFGLFGVALLLWTNLRSTA